MNTVEALDEIARIVTTTPRRRSPLEAQAGFTNAYVGLILAWGYARIGEAKRARDLAASCRTPLLDQLHDPVHGYLVASFDARIETLITGAPIPRALLARVVALGRSPRYKVDRILESLRILGPAGRPHAVEEWIKCERLLELQALASDDVAGAATALVDALAELPPERRNFLVSHLLGIVIDLEPSIARPLLHRAIRIVGELHEGHRALCYARTLALAVRFGDEELVPDMLDQVITTIPKAVAVAPSRGSDAVIEILELVLPHVARADLAAKMIELLTVAAHALGQTWSPAHVWIAGGSAALGLIVDAEPLFEDSLQRRLTMTALLEVTRGVAIAQAHRPEELALPRIVSLANNYERITDSYGTNSHTCTSVLDFVDSLVVGIATRAPARIRSTTG